MKDNKHASFFNGKLGARLAGGGHFRQLCSLLLAVAIVFGMIAITFSAPAADPDVSEAPKVFTPVYEGDGQVYGSGLPGAEIKVEKLGMVPTTALVLDSGLWAADMPTTPNAIAFPAESGVIGVTQKDPAKAEYSDPVEVALLDAADAEFDYRYIVVYRAGYDDPINGVIFGDPIPGAEDGEEFLGTDDVNFEPAGYPKAFEAGGIRYSLVKAPLPEWVKAVLTPEIWIFTVYYEPDPDLMKLTIDYNDKVREKECQFWYENDAVNLDPVSLAGAKFAKWTAVPDVAFTSNNDGVWSFIMPGEDVEVTAQWEFIAYTVTIADGGTGATGAGTYLAGETVNIFAGTKADFKFIRWTTTSNQVTFTSTDNASTAFVMPAEDVTVKANWDRNLPAPPPGGGGGGGGSGGALQTPKPPATPVPEDTGGDDLLVVQRPPSGKLLPRYEIGYANGFKPLAAFNPDHIAYLYGYKEGDVRGDANITRAEAAALIYRLLADPDKEAPLENMFEFEDWEWYAQSVNYLAYKGIIIGYEDGSFRPDAFITRAEFATMICRFDGGLGPISLSVSDAGGHWAEKNIKIGLSNGWISGYPDGSFRPDDQIQRAEVVSLINRLLYRGIEIDDIPDWAPGFTDLTPDHWAYADIVEAASGHEFERKDNGYEIWTGELG